MWWERIPNAWSKVRQSAMALYCRGKNWSHLSTGSQSHTEFTTKTKDKKHSAINVLRALLRLSSTLHSLPYSPPFLILPASKFPVFPVSDFPLLVPAPFLSSAPRYGMTLPFLHDRNSVWTPLKLKTFLFPKQQICHVFHS